MTGDCLFCHFVRDASACVPVFETDHALAFMSLYAINEGHLLVIPKEHVENIEDVPADQYVDLMSAVQRACRAVSRAIRPKRTGMIVAGFDIAHVHVHVVPMHHYHDITSRRMIEGPLEAVPTRQLAATAASLREHL